MGLKLLSTAMVESRGASMVASPVRPAVPVIEATCRCGMCFIACVFVHIMFSVLLMFVDMFTLFLECMVWDK